MDKSTVTIDVTPELMETLERYETIGALPWTDVPRGSRKDQEYRSATYVLARTLAPALRDITDRISHPLNPRKGA